MRRNMLTAGTVLVALALTAACGAEPDVSTATVEAGGVVSGYAPSPAALPDELVGSWSADDVRGSGSWTVEFGSDGAYREGNTRRGIAITGRAAVAGRRLYLQPDAADSRTVTWQVSGATLSLDGFTYRRAGQ